jgi:hypothetical protein
MPPKLRLGTSAVHRDDVAQIKTPRTTPTLAIAATVTSVCHFHQNRVTAVAKCGARLPLRNLQAFDISTIGEKEAI